MPKQSAGLLVYRFGAGNSLEVFLVHPGGPFWAKKDLGAWSIPKGELDEGEDALAAARREFLEETGAEAPTSEPKALEPVRQPSGKIVHAWAMAGDLDAAQVRSNAFTMEWPPRSGRQQSFPEVDRAAWFPLPEARRRIMSGLAPLLSDLEQLLIREGSLRG